MKGDMIKKIEARIAEEAKADPPAPVPERKKLTDFEVITCAREDQAGDAIVYLDENLGRFVYNSNRGAWMKWAGHYWEDDLDAADALAAVENVVDIYRRVAAGLRKMQNGDAPADPTGDETVFLDGPPDNGEDKQLKANIKTVMGKISNLHRVNHRDAVLKMVRTWKDKSMRIDGKELDTKPWLLPCANGVIDLRSGQLGDGRPADYLSCATGTRWTGLDTPCPDFDRFINEVLGGDEELVAYIWRVLGLAIIGEQRERAFLVLCGPGGANGKSTLMDVLGKVLGEMLMAPIQVEMLLDQSFVKSSSGPAADIMALRGLRIAYASETDENKRFSSSKVKLFSGKEKLVARGPNDKKQSYWFSTHFLILMTNELPHAKADDQAFWSRMHLVNLRYSFLPPHQLDPKNPYHRPVDFDLPTKLEAEASGILAGLVRGCLAYQKRGLDPPVQVLEATQAYRDSEDLVGRFLRECCQVGPELKIQSSVLFDAFSTAGSFSCPGLSSYQFSKFSPLPT